jgi:hypothetical protein
MPSRANAVCVFVLLAYLLSGSIAAAQVPASVASGPPDVLYRQSELLSTLDSDWSLPLNANIPRRNLYVDLAGTPAPKNPNSSGASASGNTTNPQDFPSERSKRFRWGPALGESLLYTGIMHTFDLWTEAGTRDALNGHWFQQYTRSVSELRGWSDSDTFMAPYAGHPIEGSVFGYIERQNDPPYRLVQWGDGRDYWVSLLKSMAYSAVWHTQWKIGPASEASIGNVMLHASPGFITLVDTPTLGFCTMLAEDAADRYLIMGLENRTANPVLIMLTRSFLNPGRSFANVMAFRFPWDRATRMGLFGANREMREEWVKDFKNGSGEKPFVFVKDAYKPAGVEFKHDYPLEAPIELTAFPEYESFLGGEVALGAGNGCGAHQPDAASPGGSEWLPDHASACLQYERGFHFLFRRIALDSASVAPVLALRTGEIWRQKSNLRDRRRSSESAVVEGVERRQRHAAALPDAKRLVERVGRERSDAIRGRRAGRENHEAVRVARDQRRIQPHVDRQYRGHSSTEWAVDCDRGGRAHRHVVNP